MKHSYLKYIVLGLVVLGGCKKMNDFQSNPNNPTEADPSLTLTTVELNTFSKISDAVGLASRQLVYTQSSSNTQYYGWQRQSSMGYSNITQVVKMEKEAERLNKNNYKYLGKFFRSNYIISITEVFGDVPFSQMMKVITDNDATSETSIRPAYDKQKDIYLGVLNDLKIASDSLSIEESIINGDIIYSGNIEKWKKLINSYTLRVLISLSKKESDVDLRIKERFNEIVTNPTKYPLLSGNEDNAVLNYYDITGNQYPYFNNNSMKTDYYLDSTFVKILKDYKDPRLFVYGKPKPNSSTEPKNFDSYDGLRGSATLAYNTEKRGSGEASQINDRYAYDPINEPSVFMSYSEVNFLLAEAAYRGWISGNANDFYKEGIKASLEFSNFNNTYSTEEMLAFLNQPTLNLQPGKEIEQIITQKYVSMFMNSGWIPFYEQRRTGFPTFDVAGGGVLNGGKIPKRWMYPNTEYQINGTNLEKSVKEQYPEGDNVNGVMWILQ